MASAPASRNDGAKEVFEHTSSPLVKVIIGEGDAQEVHHLHSTLLSSKSEYFRGCLEPGFSESSTGEVSLPEEDPTAFRYFIKWIYTGDLAPFPGMDTMQVVDIMIDLYVLADRVLCNELKNRTMDMTQAACWKTCISIANVTKAVRLGSRGPKMTEYLLKQLAREMCQSSHGYGGYTEATGWHDLIAADPEITTTLMRELHDWQSADPAKTDKDDPANQEGCRWHSHPNGNGREQCERWTLPKLGAEVAES